MCGRVRELLSDMGYEKHDQNQPSKPYTLKTGILACHWKRGMHILLFFFLLYIGGLWQTFVMLKATASFSAPYFFKAELLREMDKTICINKYIYHIKTYWRSVKVLDSKVIRGTECIMRLLVTWVSKSRRWTSSSGNSASVEKKMEKKRC